MTLIRPTAGGALAVDQESIAIPGNTSDDWEGSGVFQNTTRASPGGFSSSGKWTSDARYYSHRHRCGLAGTAYLYGALNNATFDLGDIGEFMFVGAFGADALADYAWWVGLTDQPNGVHEDNDPDRACVGFKKASADNPSIYFYYKHSNGSGFINDQDTGVDEILERTRFYRILWNAGQIRGLIYDYDGTQLYDSGWRSDNPVPDTGNVINWRISCLGLNISNSFMYAAQTYANTYLTVPAGWPT